jgi:AsmA family/AsmA-like C-terminal region
VKVSNSRRHLAVVALILLALFLIRPGASRLKSSIIYSISQAVGRPVDIGSVHIRLLPRPGFDLENLAVYDEPAFGAEPMLRATEVTADLRLTALARGHLEIARLDLTEPSLNLAYGDSGQWNVESLLQRSALIPLAPTVKGKSGPRPGFPYIEGTSGRINFKNGAEKRPYALTNADFSLWQDADNTWGARLQAQPFRSDMNLNDTGLLELRASWKRADKIQDTPLQVSIEWRHAQLGQLTKLLTGADQGWRGAILLNAALQGTPRKLEINTEASVDDFRRYDITSGKALSMTAFCDAEYSSLTREFRQVMCHAPVGGGFVTLTGGAGLPPSHRYSVAMTAENVPAGAMVMLAQRVKKNIPEDLTAAGTLHLTLTAQRNGGTTAARWQGKGEIADFQLSSATNKAEIGPEPLPFAIANDFAAPRRGLPARGASAQVLPGAHLELGPFPLSARAASLRGTIDRVGYRFELAGDTDIGKMLRLARMAGVPAVASTAEGSAKVNLRIAGPWRGPGYASADFTGPQVTGSAKLHNVQIAPRGNLGPVEVVSADVQLSSQTARVEHLKATAAGSFWTGSLEMPRGCLAAEKCPVHFDLKSDQIAVSDLNEWLHSKAKKRPWYQVLEPASEQRPSLLSTLHASGRVTTDLFQMQPVEATHVSANVILDDGKLQLSGIDAEMMGGRIRGDWSIDFGAKPARCKGTGNVAGLSLSALAETMRDSWIEGTADANYEIAGACSTDFWQSAEGTVRVDMKNGLLPHLLIGEGDEPLRVVHLTGQGRLKAGKIEITETKLISPAATYQVSGTASLDQELDLALTRGSGLTNLGYTVAGTVAAPHVTPLSSSMQARLKALPTK